MDNFLPETTNIQQAPPAPRPIGRPKKDPSECRARLVPETVPVTKKTRACAACERNPPRSCSGHIPCSSCQLNNQRCCYDWVPSGAPADSPTNTPDTRPSKKDAKTLMQNTFHHGLPITGFVHAGEIWDSHCRLYNSQPSTRWTENGLALDRAILYAMMSIGSYNLSRDTKDNNFSKSVQYCNQARVELEKTSEGTVKSLHAKILITQCLLDHFRMHDAWELFGTVTRHAHEIQLCREGRSRPSPRMIAHRKSLFWTIYTYDRILGSIFVQPAMMRIADNYQEGWNLSDVKKDPSNHVTALCYESNLAEMIGWIMQVLYSPHREKISDLRKVLDQIEKALQELENNLMLYLNSEKFLSLEHVHLANGRKLILTLTSYYAYLLLYRPFLQPPTSELDLEICSLHCRNQSIQRAQMILDSCEVLYAQGTFSRRSWFVSRVHFVAAVTLYECFILRPDEKRTKPRQIADSVLRRYPTDTKEYVVDRQYIEILWKLQKATMSLHNGHSAAVNETPADPSALMTGIFDFKDPFGSQFLSRR